MEQGTGFQKENGDRVTITVVQTLLRATFGFVAVICGIRAIVFELFLQGANMAIQIGRGAGRRRPVANAEVLEIL